MGLALKPRRCVGFATDGVAGETWLPRPFFFPWRGPGPGLWGGAERTEETRRREKPMRRRQINAGTGAEAARRMRRSQKPPRIGLAHAQFDSVPAEILLEDLGESAQPIRLRIAKIWNEHLRLDPELPRAPEALLQQLDDRLLDALPPLVAVRESSGLTVVAGHPAYVLSLRTQKETLLIEYADSISMRDRLENLRTVDRALIEGLQKILAKPSRPTLAHRKREDAEQFCPLCEAEGRPETLKGPKNHLTPLADGSSSELTCRRCGLRLPISPNDLRRFNDDDVSARVPTRDLWRIAPSSRCRGCRPSCPGVQLIYVGGDGRRPKLCGCTARAKSCHPEPQR